MKRFITDAKVVFKLMGESVIFAFSSLKTDKFRTFLSLFGVSIGIFSIVAVFTAVNALQNNIKQGFNAFGGDVIYLQQWPWGPDQGGEYKWWEYRKRPPVTEDEYNYIKSFSKTAEEVTYFSSFYKIFKRDRNYFNNGYVIAVSPNINKVINYEIEFGRDFSIMEGRGAANVVVIGYNVAEVLFPEGNAVGKTMKVGGKTANVIGVIKKQGKSMVQIFDTDNAVMVPLNFGKTMYNVSRSGGMIAMSPKDKIDKEEFLFETKQLLRSHRRLKPAQKDNFAVNEITFLTNIVSEILKVVNIVGWVIGGFSLLIGGFGIANIMFVSVKERTNQIGIQKALGAKKYVILTQFLVEAAVLSIAGGVLGVLLVWIPSLFLQNNETFPLVLTFGNAIKGLVIAAIIGLISGLIPAYNAANLDPVKAINS